MNEVLKAFSTGLTVRHVEEYLRGFRDASDGKPTQPSADPTGRLPFDPETSLDYFLGYEAGK